MINTETVKELIDQLPELRERFKPESVQMFSTYDFKTKQRKTGSVPLEMIYKDPVFVDWKEKLLYELTQIKEDEFVEEIKRLLTHFSGLGDKSRFDRLESKLYVLKEHLDEYIPAEEVFDDDRIPEKELTDKILRALLKLQRNNHYGPSQSEDIMNDFVRDILDESYTVKDQTRQGSSESGHDAGEVDIQICDAGFPIVMIEGIKLGSLEKGRIDSHINKVLTKYDPNGCPYVFVIAYVTASRFDSFYGRFLEYITDYSFPFPTEVKAIDVDTGYGELKHASCILNRNGRKIRLHFYTVHIQ